MVLDHVSKHARMVVVSAAQLHAELLRHRDLHVVDIPAVPDRLENRVREPEDHDVLHGFFSEVMVDAVDLGFLKVLAEVVVESSRAREVAPKRLFDDDPPPGSGDLIRQPDRAELVNDFREQRRSDRQIKKHIAREVPRGLSFRDLVLQLFERPDVVEVPLQIVAALAEILPLGVLDRARRKLLDVRRGFRAVALIITIGHGHADDRKILGEQAEDLEVVKRGEQLSLREIARCAEDDDRAGISGTVVAGERLVGHNGCVVPG